MSDLSTNSVTRMHKLTLLTNHAHVLLIIAQKPDVRMREIAATIGLTERAVQRLIDELTANGCIVVTKSGRRNQYKIRLDHPLDHPVEQSRSLGDLLRFMLPELDAA
jgi:predicted transcriptional regulator